MTTSQSSRSREGSRSRGVRNRPLPDLAGGILTDDGTPRFGVHRGIPASFDYTGLPRPYARNRIASFLRHKRWTYVFVATDEVIVVAAIVNAGPTGTGFLMATDRATGEVLADVSRPGGAGPLVSTNDRPTAGHRAHYVLPGTFMTVRGDEAELRLRATFHRFGRVPVLQDPWIDLDVRLCTDSHEGATTVMELRGDAPLVSATAKNAALTSRGQLTVRRDGRTLEYDLSEGFGGFGYTNGFLPRHTAWRWAFLTGMLPDGRTLGVNLTGGFSGLGDHSEENTCWLGGTLHRLDPAARISFDRDDPQQPWRIFTADRAVDLDFVPLAVHRESLNLGALRSRFIQPTGHFTGSLVVDGEELAIDAMPGVVEDQDILW